MNMPRFTADASLYEAGKHYTVAYVHKSIPTQTVEMSLPKGGEAGCRGFCYGYRDLDLMAACLGFCDCVYKTDNSIGECLRQLVEDAGSAPD